MYKKINKIQTFKKKWTTSDTYNNKDESQMHRAKWKKLDLKGQICMHLFIWHSGKGKTMGMENRPLVASGWSWGRVGYRGAAGGISISEWINKLWYMRTMEYYSAILKKELSSYKKTCNNLKCIIWNKRIQSENSAYYIIPMIWHYEKGKTIEMVSRPVVVRGSGRVGGKGWRGGAQRTFRAVKLFCMILSWYHMSFYMGQNSWNVQHKGWTLM